MKDLLDVLRKAKNKYRFETQEQFLECLCEIQSFDKELHLDWDDGAGEEWARVTHQKHGIVYMINSKIGIIFVRNSYFDKTPDFMTSKYEVSIVKGYDIDEWYINLEKLKYELVEIAWHSSEDAVNPDKFSLNDLYFATI